MSDVPDPRERLVAYLLDGASTTQALDRYMVGDCGMPLDLWATYRGVSERAIRQSFEEYQPPGEVEDAADEATDAAADDQPEDDEVEE